jgi:hypothetical protein
MRLNVYCNRARFVLATSVFDAAGLVVLRCDIHEHMRGLILVVNTPYFALPECECAIPRHSRQPLVDDNALA